MLFHRNFKGNDKNVRYNYILERCHVIVVSSLFHCTEMSQCKFAKTPTQAEHSSSWKSKNDTEQGGKQFKYYTHSKYVMDLFHFHILEPFFVMSIKIKASGRCERLTPVPQGVANIMSTRDYICPVHSWTFNVAAVSCKHLLQDDTLVRNISRSSVFLSTAELNVTRAARKLQAPFISSIPLHSRWDTDLFFSLRDILWGIWMGISVVRVWMNVLLIPYHAVYRLKYVSISYISLANCISTCDNAYLRCKSTGCVS